jgi:hypothetical protein
MWYFELKIPEDGRPARKVVTGRRHRLTGNAPCRKSLGFNEMVWESELELMFIILETFDPKTTTISAQPHTLYVRSDKFCFHYTPDFILGRDPILGPPEVVEIKPTNVKFDDQTLLKLAVSRACYREIGHDFSIRTQSHIAAKPRICNAKLLLRYQAAAIRPGLSYLVSKIFCARESDLTISDCVAKIDGNPDTRFELYALACAGLIEIDLNEPLCPQTRIMNCSIVADLKHKAWSDS